MQDYVIGVDIGGTNIKAGAVDHRGTILAKMRISTEARLGGDAILDKLQQLVTNLKTSVPERRLKAVGFGIPGAIRSRDWIVTQAPNVASWDGLPIRKLLEERIQCACFIENDANAVALGEMWVGAGRGYSHICCLTLGTGVGGGVIIDGELLRGADGMAAELGHIPIQADGARCNCGSRGCLETFASATGILQMLNAASLRDPENPLFKISHEQRTTAVVYEHAKKGNTLALEIFRDAANGLGAGLAAFVNMLNPEIIIIGGGVAAAWDLLIPPALETMKQRAFKAPVERVKVVPAEKEDDAGVHGSAYVAWDMLQHGNSTLSRERSITPWGFWQVIEDANDYKVKRIYVHAGHRLSYQKHQQREETWMIASGQAIAIIDDQEHHLQPGDTIHVRKTQAHRIASKGDSPLIFFEVQRGTYFGEDDIVRLQDDYKRV